MDHVFISYAHSDREFCEQLASLLEARGVNVWVDREDLPPATVWREQLWQAIAESNSVAVLISPESMASEHVHKEIDQAIESGKAIVPFVVHPTPSQKVPEVIRAIQWIDSIGMTRSETFDQILIAVRQDHVWRRQHGELLARAEAWERGCGFVLRHNELGVAVAWLAEADAHRRPTALHRRYIQASREYLAD